MCKKQPRINVHEQRKHGFEALKKTKKEQPVLLGTDLFTFRHLSTAAGLAPADGSAPSRGAGMAPAERES